MIRETYIGWLIIIIIIIIIIISSSSSSSSSSIIIIIIISFVRLFVDDNIDVGNDSSDLILTCDGPSLTDSSMSTRGSTSPPSTDGKPSPTSSISSPGSGCGSINSPEQEGPPVRKKARTNYTPGQVKALERQFHENPYPDAEMMETLSQNLQIPENKLKV